MLRDFISYYAPHKRLFWLDFGSAILSGLLELGFPLAIAAFVDHLLPQGDLGMTLLASVGLLGVYLLNTGLMAIVIYWGHKLGIEIETEMRRRAFSHLLKLGWGWYDRAKTGHLVQRVTRDLDEIGEVAHHGPEDMMIAVMTFIGAFVLMLNIHAPLALLTALIVPLTIWIVIVYGKGMTKTWREIFGRMGQFNVRLEQAIGGIRLVQAFANEDHERKLFAKDNEAYRSTKMTAYKMMAQSSAIQYMGLRFVQVVVMVAGAYYVMRGDLTAGGFVGFLLLVNVFFRPLDKIASVIETYPRGIAGFRRYRELLMTEPDLEDAPHAKPIEGLRGDIRFDQLRFAYAEGGEVLRGIDLDIRAGETVAFIGTSGAGKTTLLSLLPRFYQPTGGRILVDGHDVRDITLESLRRQIGLVSQDVFLFGASLRDNIAYGRLDATEAEIWAAAEKAQLLDFIHSLPEGLQTQVGERGVMLSGGQKQRVAIARVFLRNPPILILDEATSALDTATERDIQAALEELSVGRTTLVIAHRLATIRNADRIVVIEQGQIVEQGPHAALLAQGGVYARLAQA